MKKAQIKSVTMPAGKYWVGDPCYAVPDHRWIEWLEAADYTEQNVLVAELDGRTILGIGTAYGDGTYPGSDGNEYPVDAGLIGLVPVEIADYSDSKHPAGAIMQQVEFDHDFDCRSFDDGTIVLGHIEIETGTDDEEDC